MTEPSALIVSGTGSSTSHLPMQIERSNANVVIEVVKEVDIVEVRLLDNDVVSDVVVLDVVVVGHAASCPGQQFPSIAQPASHRQNASCPSMTSKNRSSVLSHPETPVESGVIQMLIVVVVVVVVVVGAGQTV